MDKLIQKLSNPENAVNVSRYDTTEEFYNAIKRGTVLIKFTDTKGGTELGIKIDEKKSNFNKCDFKKKIGVVHLEGNHELNYVKVDCIADINLKTLKGKGYLAAVDPDSNKKTNKNIIN